MIAVFAVIIVIVALLLVRCESSQPATVRVVAVGDMDCDPADPDMDKNTKALGDLCRHKAVSDIAVALNPTILLGLGDFQYELPKAAAYRTVYGPTYGRLLNRTVPVFGNQEYKIQDANTFTAYFGNRIMDKKGYWSQQVGKWHILVLNSNCSAVTGGCGTGSPQQEWLVEDLKANKTKCVLAAWHHPRWSTGINGPDPRAADLYKTLFDYKVDLVLSGHEADYERFAPLNPDGTPDPHGVRQFVIGTGGQAHYRPAPNDDTHDEQGNPISTTGRPTSEYVDYDHHGVLELDLSPDSYKWSFHPLEADSAVTDTGSAKCY
ncbi:hypothetical protein GCM10010435_57280 [Winogradskya consettensis]|uniref:Calcineurin-like phosphoesterase domain-containing protein n=1 Tax=Winogradskya consettensis TaxID=113560 RepID=A0A919S7Z2_9ACTN|nr:hypothetical protein Aco04nite_05040 [Actinoplanes consettensis]